MEELEELAREPFRIAGGQARHVATRARQTGNDSASHRIGHRPCNDWDRAGGFAGSDRSWHAVRYEKVDLAIDHISHQGRQSLKVSIRGASLDQKVFSFDPTQLTQPLPERRKAKRGG